MTLPLQKGSRHGSRLGFTARLALASVMSCLLIAPGAMAKGAAKGADDVSLAQMQQKAIARFTQQDANKDGFLTVEEMKASKPAAKNAQRAGQWMQKRIQKQIEKQDTNKDGKLSLPEIQAGVVARFTQLDANKDGVIKAEEMKNHRGKHRQKGTAQNKNRS